MAAAAYIRADRPSAARAFREQISGALEQLVAFPEAGRVIPEFPGLGFREALVGSYRVFYKVRDGVVWVVGVWHDAQIPGEPAEPSGGEPALPADGKVG